MKITKQLLTEAKKFYKKFGDVVPLRELPETTTTEEVVDVIRESLTTGEPVSGKIRIARSRNKPKHHNITQSYTPL